MASSTIDITVHPGTPVEHRVSIRVQEIAPGETAEDARTRSGSHDLVIVGRDLQIFKAGERGEEKEQKKVGGPMILLEDELAPGEEPKPWYDQDGQPHPPVVVRLDERPSAEIPEDEQ